MGRPMASYLQVREAFKGRVGQDRGRAPLDQLQQVVLCKLRDIPRALQAIQPATRQERHVRGPALQAVKDVGRLPHHPGICGAVRKPSCTACKALAPAGASAARCPGAPCAQGSGSGLVTLLHTLQSSQLRVGLGLLVSQYKHIYIQQSHRALLPFKRK